MLNPQIVIDILNSQLVPLAAWLKDKTVTEIMVNPGGHVFVEAAGTITYVGQLLTEHMISTAIKAVAKHVRKDARANTNSAIVNASIDDLRISGALSPVSPGGSFITIRKHQDAGDRPTMEDLINKKQALTAKQAQTIEQLVLHDRNNLIIAGGTGSGKTTLLNALLNKIPGHERIITIEDSREIQISVPNFIPLLTNPDEGISARDMVKMAMRSRPDRLILGETRGDETYDLIRAFNSGHPGSISTIHADSAEEALGALEMLFQMSLPANASISSELARGYIAKSVKVVVFVNRSIEFSDGQARVIRKIQEICLVKGVINGNYVLENVA
ncbi:CpaF family protein [Janthinobacterium lividum]|jgi:pilus assembly protein CpaF|uniref:CpaF family protein n=1 Tax=Janthinobacterium TaxID=29580 RepID=UPI000875652C|nr:MULTISPECIES: ATPase, T2SS/T4P/T4SS family [Janthinobacterium]MCC7712246.1 CpaF family protein [Janthinobacterium lividum]OEZ54939.1 type IV secretion system protein VirB11 [Janthinobacterium lividum]PHV23311.1 CpaF family protein [Janthinobacterium sp. BJB446]WQE27078.1 ATPase, T2SS/T4P/T4SS family [Janthinobacterium lividum]SDG80739.1 Pilus assembly protein, ATPase of CpaF family [Janthinobacterium sp. YR213]